MKPPAFDYVAPSTTSEAIAVLVEHAGEARPLSGGQSLVPMLNFRLLAPAVLVDLTRIDGISGIEITPDVVRVGATTRTARLLDPAVDSALPLLSAAARLVAHPQIRNRGTVGGSIANADPAAELPAVALLAGASIRIEGPKGARAVPADAFFQGLFTTDCGFDEIVVGIDFPRPRKGAGWGFREFARRPGDFALAGVGALVELKNDAIAKSTIVVFGVGSRPVRAAAAERSLLVSGLSNVQAARAALEAELAPESTVFGSAAYKRHISGELFELAVADAISRARGLELGARHT
jgi:carbon-monoxide dehydrogenase medium subunit